MQPFYTRACRCLVCWRASHHPHDLVVMTLVLHVVHKHSLRTSLAAHRHPLSLTRLPARSGWVSKHLVNGGDGNANEQSIFGWINRGLNWATVEAVVSTSRVEVCGPLITCPTTSTVSPAPHQPCATGCVCIISITIWFIRYSLSLSFTTWILCSAYELTR